MALKRNLLSIAVLLLTLFSPCQSFSDFMFRATQPTAAFAVRVVSYNVLSSQLASPSHYTTLDPAHLEASNRLPLVLKKLEAEISEKPKSILCLQEVSQEWAGELHTWFANKGFHMITGLYGRKFNGYMGVAIAYPTSIYETVSVDISRLSDKRYWPRAPKESALVKLLGGVTNIWMIPLKAIGLLTPPKEDHWSMSQRRFNILVTTTLKEKATSQEFAVGCYHMPCAFYMPMTMTIHCELAAQHVQKIAGSKPCVLAGDWNIKPESAQYKMMTTGKMANDDLVNFPTPKHGMEFEIKAAPMRSAYAEVQGGEEPNFTNYARIKEDDPFIDTLDYIFLSDEWSVSRVKPIVHRDVANGPYPNAVEPSDHVLIAADLTLGSK